MDEEIIEISYTGSSEYNFHLNITIDSTTTFNHYFNEVGETFNYKLEHGYGYDSIEYFKVKVWNLDLVKNSKIKIHNKGIDLLGHRTFSTTSVNYAQINPITKPDSLVNFATMDLETMDFNGNQKAITISSKSIMGRGSKLFIVDTELIKTDLNLAISQMWKQYFDYLIRNKDVLFRFNSKSEPSNTLTIFVHNLGSFDGYFLYKGLIIEFNPTMVNAIIDDSKRFITISLKLDEDYTIVWKDSLRIFPVSLDKLCNTFKIKGKLSNYDIRFNNIDLFNNPRLFHSFKDFAAQDSLALYEALRMAKNIYFRNFRVDITTIFSTSTLSLKIFRRKFLKTNIPILPNEIDSFVRLGYYGGATDYYKAYETNLKYYDVNSLYPFAMKNPMPLNLIKSHKNMDNINLNNFFGIIEVDIEYPLNMERSLLPF